MKKLFITSSFLLVLVLIFFVAYNVAFKKDDKTQEKNASGQSEKSSENSGGQIDSRIKPITDEPVVGIFLDRKNEKINFYSAVNGRAWQVDLLGEKKKSLSDSDLVGLEDVIWSSSGQQVISVFKRGDQQKSFSVYDYQQDKSAQLGRGMETVAWDNSGAKIIYKYFEESTGNKNISIANPDGSDWKKIADTEIQEVAIDPIPQTSLVSFWNEGKHQDKTGLFTVGINGGEVWNIFSERFGADYKWAPNGEKAVVSYLKDQNSNGMTTGLIDIKGSYTDLGVPTLVSKMEWSLDNKYIYYALPAIPENVTMPDDYKANKFKTTDTFWKINTQNGEKIRLIGLEEINGAYDASGLFLSPSEDALFFVNRVDEKIYRLDL